MNNTITLEAAQEIARRVATKFVKGELAKHIKREREEFDEVFEDGQTEIDIDIDAEDREGWKDVEVEISIGLFSGFFFNLTYKDDENDMIEEIAEAIEAFRALELDGD